MATKGLKALKKKEEAKEKRIILFFLHFLIS